MGKHVAKFVLAALVLACVAAPVTWTQSSAVQQELESLARSLRNTNSAGTYARLEKFAQAHRNEPPGDRAALALGYSDYSRRRYAQASRWFAHAQGDEVLREYAVYWGALADRAQGRTQQAFVALQNFRGDFPASVMAADAVAAYAEAALALRRTSDALAALNEFSGTSTKPPLLLLRARANEQASQRSAAAADYAKIYYGYPLSAEASAAGAWLNLYPKDAPAVSGEQRLARAEAFFTANRLRDAQIEFKKQLPKLTGADREMALLRIAQSNKKESARVKPLSQLKVTSDRVEAERLYALSQAYRSARRESDMLAAIEEVALRFPQSVWSEEALFAGGNHYWVRLDHARAAGFYERVATRFPTGKNALNAHWRTAWHAYLEKPAEAPQRIEEHLRRYPGSTYTANALYWLGRSAERGGDAPRARTFYLKAIERFPQTYYGRQSAERLRAVGTGQTAVVEVLAAIPAPVPAPSFDQALPATAEARRKRAQALQGIGFDASAENELRAAFAETGAPRLLLEAAQVAHDGRRHTVGIVTARQVFPQLEARRLQDVPDEVWRSVYPMAYHSDIESTAELAGVDPMLVAGLIRQESVFQSGAVSRAGAIGLMQVMPQTGRGLARRLKLRYSKPKLFQADFNLRLGTVHLADLIRGYNGSVEKALAAYNAGEHRVVAWTDGRAYSEPAEFVETIPFTETREYVQIVMRNAEIYRRLYGGEKPSSTGSGK